jgi:hypothetical protein
MRARGPMQTHIGPALTRPVARPRSKARGVPCRSALLGGGGRVADRARGCVKTRLVICSRCMILPPRFAEGSDKALRRGDQSPASDAVSGMPWKTGSMPSWTSGAYWL